MKKNFYGLCVGVLSLLLVKSVFAAGYQPLVNIPGLPSGGVVDISAYLVGLYNFLLSIVGILAVIMLIIGGMRYITAAGSGGSVTGAKESIRDALLGLILALMSWVIVSTINPDVLYLRQPGAAFNKSDATQTALIGRCYKTSASEETSCICKDNYTPSATEVTTEAQCQAACSISPHCNVANQNFCIKAGTTIGPSDRSTYKGTCTCVVGGSITMPAGMQTCQEACLNANMCGYKFLSVALMVRRTPDQVNADGSYIYHLSATASPADEIWEMTETNDYSQNYFSIANFNQNNTVGKDKDGNVFPCALIVTNIKAPGWTSVLYDNNSWVFWVRDGVTVGEKNSLYEDLGGDFATNKGGNYISGCTHVDGLFNGAGTDIYGVLGTCDQKYSDIVLRTLYSDDVVNKCGTCDLAQDNYQSGTSYRSGKSYEFVRPLTCRSGFWQ